MKFMKAFAACFFVIEFDRTWERLGWDKISTRKLTELTEQSVPLPSQDTLAARKTWWFHIEIDESRAFVTTQREEGLIKLRLKLQPCSEGDCRVSNSKSFAKFSSSASLSLRHKLCLEDSANVRHIDPTWSANTWVGSFIAKKSCKTSQSQCATGRRYTFAQVIKNCQNCYNKEIHLVRQRSQRISWNKPAKISVRCRIERVYTISRFAAVCAGNKNLKLLPSRRWSITFWSTITTSNLPIRPNNTVRSIIKFQTFETLSAKQKGTTHPGLQQLPSGRYYK